MNAGDSHKCHGAVLFLDTPRAGEGLNHRFFVAHPAGCDEAQVVHWARQARENSSGLDYLAVSRPVSQVLRGQARSGTELLVFAGISTGDSERNAQIRARLNSMLDMLQREQVAAEGNGLGLLLPSRKIAEFQRELRSQTEAAQDSTESAGPPAPSRRQGKLKLLLMLSLIVVFGAVVLAQIGAPHGKSRPANDKSPESASKEKKGARSFSSKKEPEPDWSFLRDDPYWQSLTRLTAFHGGQANATAAQSWANSLLTAADPRWQAKEVTPGDLKNNKHVGNLLDAVRSASRETSRPDAESVSMQWLSSLPSNDTKDISEFWAALSKPKSMSATALKKLLLDWEQKLIVAASHPTDLANLGEELRPFAALTKEPATTAIQILAQPDIDRFLRMKAFFDSVEFSNAIGQSAYGEDWRSRDWTERLRKLKGLSTDGQLPGPLRSLCNELNSSVIR